jgi:hypothetical protein
MISRCTIPTAFKLISGKPVYFYHLLVHNVTRALLKPVKKIQNASEKNINRHPHQEADIIN